MNVTHASRLSTGLLLVVLALTSYPAIGARPQVPQQPGQTGAQVPARHPVEIAPPVAKLGKVAPNSVTAAKFTLTNTTAAPVTVTAAQPSCKCTAISDIVGSVIAPGASLEFTASLKAPPTPGPKDAKVSIRFAEIPAPLIAMIEGEVEMSVVAEPPFIDALKGVTTGKIKVRSTDGKPFRVLAAGGKAPVLTGFDAAKDAPRDSYEIAWDVAGITVLPLWWTIETDRPDVRILPLRIRNENTGFKWDMPRYERQWFVKDQIVFAGDMKVGVPTEVVVELEYFNPKMERPKLSAWRELRSVVASDPSVTVKVMEQKPVGEEHIELTLQLTASKAGTIASELIVTTATGAGPIPLVAKVQ
ncbi:MAG: DUF1573 domain-containing protein [Phycisphaerae bacterium]|nr:DUF1573 domain-containing protein [Phycisphaerae bacterium]